MPGPKIEYITNVTAYAQLDPVTYPGNWKMEGGFPLFPDEIIIRQITYVSSVPTSDVCLISSNINGSSFIGSVVTSDNFTSCPQTIITVRSPLPNQLTFQLQMPLQPPAPYTPQGQDMISITMDFIKYKKPVVVAI
jgi:hypothetical protein